MLLNYASNERLFLDLAFIWPGKFNFSELKGKNSQRSVMTVGKRGKMRLFLVNAPDLTKGKTKREEFHSLLVLNDIRFKTLFWSNSKATEPVLLWQSSLNTLYLCRHVSNRQAHAKTIRAAPAYSDTYSVVVGLCSDVPSAKTPKHFEPEWLRPMSKREKMVYWVLPI